MRNRTVTKPRPVGSGIRAQATRAFARGYTLPHLRRSYLVSSLVLFLAAMLASALAAQTPTQTPHPPEQRTRYQINLALDPDNRTYKGTERVRWINRGEHPTSTLFLHLYPNLRAPGYVPPTEKTATGQPVADEPRLEIAEVRNAANNLALVFALDDQETTLRIHLREAVAPNASVEVAIKFKGSVPEIDPEETGLVTHVLQQVSAAIRSTREIRRARDTNFRCREVLMLGAAYPVLAAREGDDWFRKVESNIGDALTTDTADYEVTVSAPREVVVYTPVPARTTTPGDKITASTFTAENLRDFVIIAGNSFRSEESRVGDVTVRSIFRPDHEVAAQRVLKIATEAVRVYSARFGPLPLRTISLVDVPLVATIGSVEFAGVSAIASAFYLDFDSPTMRNMPDVIREQRPAVEDSLEWTVAHVTAHQWWGAVVGNDPSREPVLDESLANWSALLYYRETHGEEQFNAALEEQLRGVYKLYRTFGGEDMEADRAARDYRNTFQYAAIVASKGALMFEALRKLLGDEKFFAALRDYYKANALEVADMDDLRGAFIAGAPVEQRRAVNRTFDRWLSSKRGDEDIGPPDPKLAAELGLPARQNQKGDKNFFTAFAKVGKFFWQQMTRIR
ncbi:MAG: M1 family metallopeptidase [Acidobacteriota bacterium]